MKNKKRKLIQLMALSAWISGAYALAQIYQDVPPGTRASTGTTGMGVSSDTLNTPGQPRDRWQPRDAMGEERALTRDAGYDAAGLSDREIASKARRAVVDDKTLSTSAHNVKILARHGKVTLKGKVESEEEKNSIISKVAEIVGPENVTDKLMIKTRK